MGDDDRDRQLDPLAAVHRARVGQLQAVGVLVGEAKHRVLGAEDERGVLVVVSVAAAAGVDLVEQAQHGAVHQAELVQVAPDHHELVAETQPPSAHGLAVGVERGPQRPVERVDAQIAAVDGGEHLDVADRVDVVVGGQALGHQGHDLLERRPGRRPLDQEEVAPHALGGAERGRVAAADGVGSLDDHAVGGLAEDVGQPRHRHPF